MLEVYRAAADLRRRFEAQGWRFCLIGGLALQRWGEPRETIDVDVTLLTGFGSEERFVREMLMWFEPRIADPLNFALQTRVLLVQAPSGVGLDIALGGMRSGGSCRPAGLPHRQKNSIDTSEGSDISS